MKVEIVEIGDQKVLCYPHRGPYNQIGEAFGKLYQYAAPRGLIQGNGYGIYYDDPEGKDPAELRSDACVAIKGDVAVDPPLEIKILKGGKFGKYLHMGSYSKLGEAWDKLLGEYVPTYGLEFDNSRVAFEKYLNDMNSTPEEKLETEIYVPVL